LCKLQMPILLRSTRQEPTLLQQQGLPEGKETAMAEGEDGDRSRLQAKPT
jgi:hypothetical protein